MNLPKFSQWDSRWGAINLGKSDVNMASHGCYVTSFCMAAHNWGIMLDPGAFVTRLNEVNAFTPDGMLAYDGLMRAFPSLNFNERVYTTNDPDRRIGRMTIESAIDRIRQLLLIGMPTLLAVDELPFNKQLADHAVVARDFRGEGLETDFLVNNPNGASSFWFSEKYGMPAKFLYGYISATGPAQSWPEQSIEIHHWAGKAAWKLGQAQRGISPEVYYKEALDSLVRMV